ncbi:MAG TPA: TetR/AcrR family transcriptional regulator [Lapillicoccus sp.]
MAPRKTLTRDHWAATGLAALVEGGPDAVRIEPVAARLGTTKGSAYWHFADRADLLRAVLDLWVAKHTVAIRDRVEADGGTARERLKRLLDIVSAAAEQSPADMLLVASADADVRAAVVEATQLRVAYVERLIREDGTPGPEARSRAVLAYAAYLGHASLTAAVPGLVPHRRADRRRMEESLLAMALPGVTRGRRAVRGGA